MRRAWGRSSPGWRCEPEADERGTFDLALLLAPFFLGNAPVRQAWTRAASALKPDGALYFQAHKRRGGDTFVGYARGLFEDVELMGMGGGQRRLYRATGPRPGATSADASAAPAAGAEAPGAGGGDPRGDPQAAPRGRASSAPTASIPGSLLLAQTAQVPPGARVLDLGCGAGPIGLAVAASDPRSRVLLVDASRPAVELARENAARNELQNVEVLLSDGYEALGGQRFDAILSNLPAHQGQQADSGVAERFIAGAPARLREDGAAWFVANKALPYELPAARAFRRVRVAAGDGRYKVLHCDQPVPQTAPVTARRGRAILTSHREDRHGDADARGDAGAAPERQRAPGGLGGGDGRPLPAGGRPLVRRLRGGVRPPVRGDGGSRDAHAPRPDPASQQLPGPLRPQRRGAGRGPHVYL